MAIGHISDIDLRLLRVFACVVETGGFSAACAEMNVTRSAVSLRMSELEQRLGMRLCRRGRSGFQLTDEGRIVHQAVVRLFADLDEFRARIDALRNDLSGDLCLGITDNLVTSPHMRITRVLNALREIGPRIRFNVCMTTPDEVVRGVADGRFHLGAVPDHKASDAFEAFPLYEEEILLYCGADHPLASEADEQRILDALGLHDAAALDQGPMPPETQATPFLNVCAKSKDREGIAFLILSGKYIGLLPNHYASRWVEKGQMKVLAPSRIVHVQNYNIIVRRGGHEHKLTKAFLHNFGSAAHQA